MAYQRRRLDRCTRTLALIALVSVVVTLAPVAAHAYVRPPVYRRQGNATEVSDPQNASNDIVRFESTFDGGSSVTRDLRAKRLKVDDLTNMISVKYHFVDRTCAGGSPRFQLNIDLGNGEVHNAFGYFGNKAFGGDCVPNTWIHEDLANLATTGPTWDLSQFGGPILNTWAQVITFFLSFPDHKVRACGVFDDSGTFAPASRGAVYLDDVQCQDRVLEDALDVTPGTGSPF